MKLTKLTILAATAAFVLNASAKLPSGYESVVIKATVMTENGAKVVTTKITTDDILTLIDQEFGTSYSKQHGGKGFQLVSQGVGYAFDGEYDIFSVMNQNGVVVLANASFSGAYYELYLYPYNDSNWVESYKGDKYTYTVPSVELYYRSGDDNDTFNVYGTMTDNVVWGTIYSENYSVKNGQGSMYFIDVTTIRGPVTGASISGSGTDVYPFND
jgi:hypothetical protein